MIDQHVDGNVEGATARRGVLGMQIEQWGVTFASWPAAGVLAGAPVDLRALERAAALVRPSSVGEGARDWEVLDAVVDGLQVQRSLGELDSPTMLWDVRGAFYFGSADPHGMGDIDAVRLPRKRATFSLLAYDAARLEDLIRRPMPRLNMPMRTEPLPVYAGLLSAFPPLVTRLDQVVPVATIRLIGRWMRRFRRMAAAARRGNASLARRLRPEDLWLPESSHTVPAARGWIWDLRPLARGLPAQVIVAGEARVRDDLNRQAISIFGIDYPDRAIIDECLRGFCDDSTVEVGSLFCAPHSGALAFFDQAEAKIAKSVLKGWAEDHERLPMWPIRCCPYSVVDESAKALAPKFRLTNDLSWPKPGVLLEPHGLASPSLNDAMDRSAWPPVALPRLAQMSSAMMVLKASGAPVLAWKVDAEAFYRKIGRRPDQVWRQAMVTPAGNWQIDWRGQFGDASMAVKALRHSDHMASVVKQRLRQFDTAYPSRDPIVLAWQRERSRLALELGVLLAELEPFYDERWAVLHMYGQFVDDGGGASIDDLLFDEFGRPMLGPNGEQLSRARAHLELVEDVFDAFGHVSSPEKRMFGARIELLGVDLDLDEGRMRLASGKRERYAALCRASAASEFIQLAEFRELLGKLTFASIVYPKGRQWVAPCWRSFKISLRSPALKVFVTRHVRKALLLWASELEDPEHVGVPMACREWMPLYGAPGVGVIYADASGEEGWAAWTFVSGVVYMVSGVWGPLDIDLIIADKELIASTIGLFVLGEAHHFQYVWEFTDNTVALSAIRSLTPSTPLSQRLCAARVIWCSDRSVFVMAERITSANNEWADIGSRPVTRGGPAAVASMAASLGFEFVDFHVVDWREIL